jgi:phospholipase C
MRMRTSLWFLASSVAATAAACSSGPGDVTATASAAEVTIAPRADAGAGAGETGGRNDSNTHSPIKHVVVIVGENRTFDHVFATYKPTHGQLVDNLLSKKIVNEDGTPGPLFALALQKTAVDSAPSRYELSPGSKKPYKVLPPALAGGPTTPFIATDAEAAAVENGLPADYVHFLTTGGTGLKSGAVDARIPNATSLPPGPFQLTPGVPYDAYAASPVHRFYEMWQQLDCSSSQANLLDPSGCRSDLFPWVETTIGAGNNGNPQPANFTNESTGEGSTSMGFYNMLQGDAPYFKSLADTYAMSDNFHQAIQGGTGANHIALGTGDADWYSDGKGNALVPPVIEIENPDPQAGTNNWYTQDGYSGGSYSECSDPNQPGVGPVEDYLQSQHVNPNCEDGHYYLLNNYNPGYLGDGSLNTSEFTIPPTSTPTIGDELLAHDISWAYYGDQWNRYVADPNGTDPTDLYCNICNPFQYESSIMGNPAVRDAHMKDTIDLYNNIANGWLPAFSIVKPSGLVDGHPASSKLDLFEGFSKKIVDLIKAQPDLWKDTAIIITFDEGGGYYDSGYVAPVSFFGDGTRIPAIVVSPYATGGYISHEYSDHVSILKFVERNWGLPPVTKRSRDNLPNPVTIVNPWVPVNGPSIDDMFDLFDFGHPQL